MLVNQPWLVDELRGLGHQVLTAGWVNAAFDIPFSAPTPVGTILDRLPGDFHLNRIVYYDDSNPPRLLSLDSLPCPSIFYSVDTHHHCEWHTQFAYAFDAILLAQKDYLKDFKKSDNSAEWFPLWASGMESSEAEGHNPTEDRSIGISFRGNLNSKLHPKRHSFFKNLSSLEGIDIDYASGPWQETYKKSKIVLNQTVGKDLNCRIFEAMSCGALLLTPANSGGLLDLFEDGMDLVTFDSNDTDDLARKLRHYLSNNQERAKIADSGRAKVLGQHCAHARALQLEKLLLGIEKQDKPNKYFGLAIAYLTASINTSSPNYAQSFAREALEKLLISQVYDSTKKEQFEGCYLTCKCNLELCGEQGLALEMGRIMHERDSSNYFLLLNYLEDLRKFDNSFRSEELPKIGNLLDSLAKLRIMREKTMHNLRAKRDRLPREIEEAKTKDHLPQSKVP